MLKGGGEVAAALDELSATGSPAGPARLLLEVAEGGVDGGPVGLDTIAASISEDADTIMDVYEPYLLQLGYIQRTPRGRTITKLGRAHVGIAATGEAKLF